MLILLMVIFSVVLTGYTLYSTGDMYTAIRRGLTSIAVFIVLAVPVGEWETVDYSSSYNLESGGFYVVPSEYSVEDYGDTYRITPIYTSLLSSCFSEEEVRICYSTLSCTRKEAIHQYIAHAR